MEYQFYHSMSVQLSKSMSHYDWRSVSPPGRQAPSGAHDRILIYNRTTKVLVVMERPLWLLVSR